MQRRTFKAGMLLSALALAACGGGGGAPQNQAPNASVAANAASGSAPLAVSFDASASTDADGTVVSFRWDFDGDGAVDQTTSVPTALFTYTTAGTFDARLTVVDDGGATDEDTAGVTVTELTLAKSTVTPDIPTNSDALQALVVDGVPAICFHSEGELRFVRALDADGSQWGAPVDVEAVESVDARLAVVAGNPAVLYNTVGGEVHFARASDPQGGAWGAPVVVASTGTPSPVDLLLIEGVPAAVFTLNEPVSGRNEILYLRAEDAQGSSWPGNAIQATPESASASRQAAAVVAGRPALAYSNGSDVEYIRALNSDGSRWPDTAVALGNVGDIDNVFSLAVLDGRPALAFSGNEDLVFGRASDTEGAAWPALRVLLTEAEAAPDAPKIFTAADRAALSFNGTDASLQLLLASDAAGDAFGTRLTIEPGAVRGHAPLELNGAPAVAYFLTGGALQFAVAR